MKAIILAAGKGKRLQPYTKNIPKCLLTLDKETILEHQINHLKSSEIQEINVVVTAMHPLIFPIKKYSLFADPSEPKTTPAIIKPVNPAIIEPVNLDSFSLVLIAVFSEISVDRAAKGRLILV